MTKDTEKLATYRGRAARLIMGGALAASMMVAPMSAFAVTGDSPTNPAGETGSVTINPVTGNEGVTYDVYQIFKADVDASGNATHIQWANADMKTAVEGVIAADATANSRTYAGTTAQDALEYLYNNMGAGSYSSILASGSLGDALADAVDGVSSAKVGTQTAGTTVSTYTEGLYLFVTNTASVGADQAGSAPMFVRVNADEAVSITEKTTLPTVAKETTDGNIDLQRGATQEFKLTATMPSNIATYDNYRLQFTDAMTHMTMTSAEVQGVSVVVKNGSTTTPIQSLLTESAGSISFSEGTLVVNIADLKALGAANGFTVNADTTVEVVYSADLTTDAVATPKGNNNSVKLLYSSNPNTNATQETTPSRNVVDIYTFGLQINKIDKSTLGNLQGAEFTIKNAAGTYVSSVDGTLLTSTLPGTSDSGYSDYIFTTDSSGLINVVGLDAGTYTITEITPPAGYDAIDAPITLTITPAYTDGQLSGLAATFAGGEGDGVDSNADGIVESGSGVYSADSATGIVQIKVTNDKEIQMPITGEQGTLMLTIAGVGIIGISMAAMYRNRRKENASE